MSSNKGADETDRSAVTNGDHQQNNATAMPSATESENKTATSIQETSLSVTNNLSGTADKETPKTTNWVKFDDEDDGGKKVRFYLFFNVISVLITEPFKLLKTSLSGD